MTAVLVGQRLKRELYVVPQFGARFGRFLTWQSSQSGVTLATMKSQTTPNAGWSARHDMVVQITSPEIAAEKLGRTIESVLARRNDLGLPDFEPRVKSPQGLHNKKRRRG
jgi:hypothetical protein